MKYLIFFVVGNKILSRLYKGYDIPVVAFTSRKFTL